MDTYVCLLFCVVGVVNLRCSSVASAEGVLGALGTILIRMDFHESSSKQQDLRAARIECFLIYSMPGKADDMYLSVSGSRSERLQQDLPPVAVSRFINGADSPRVPMVLITKCNLAVETIKLVDTWRVGGAIHRPVVNSSGRVHFFMKQRMSRKSSR